MLNDLNALFDSSGCNFQLSADEVHIWQFSFSDINIDDVDMLALLSKDECERAARFIPPKRREHFIKAHALLRVLLAKYLNINPSDIQFDKGEHGKPFLPAALNPLDLQFNVSDSNDQVLYGLSLRQAIGVDVEYMQRKVEFEGLAKRFFSNNESRGILALSGEARIDAFFRCWTRKEAYIKAIGLGLSFPLDQFDVSLESEGTHCLLHVAEDAKQAQQWSLCSLNAPKNYMAALAYDGNVKLLRYFPN